MAPRKRTGRRLDFGTLLSRTVFEPHEHTERGGAIIAEILGRLTTRGRAAFREAPNKLFVVLGGRDG